jgi:hypothetical protein
VSFVKKTQVINMSKGIKHYYKVVRREGPMGSLTIHIHRCFHRIATIEIDALDRMTITLGEDNTATDVKIKKNGEIIRG